MSDVSHAGVTVSDLDRSIWYYGELLGMEQKRRYVSNIDLARPMWNSPSLEQVESCLVQMPNSEQQIQLVQATGQFGPARQRGARTKAEGHLWDIGNAHFGFRVDDLEVTVARLGEHGFIPLSGEIVRGEAQYADLKVVYVPDPDGFYIELVEWTASPDGFDDTHAGITVSDLERSLWYYRDILGMELLRRYPGDVALTRALWNAPEVQSLEVALLAMPGQVQHVELRQVRGLPQNRIQHKQWDVGFSHVSLAVPDLERLVGKLAEAGIAPRAYLRGEGLTNSFVANSHIPDPDGFDLELIQVG